MSVSIRKILIKRLIDQIHFFAWNTISLPTTEEIWEWNLRGTSSVVAIHQFTEGSIEKEWQNSYWKSHPHYNEACKILSPYPLDHNLGKHPKSSNKRASCQYMHVELISPSIKHRTATKVTVSFKLLRATVTLLEWHGPKQPNSKRKLARILHPSSYSSNMGSKSVTSRL